MGIVFRLPLVEVGPRVYDEDHGEDEEPSNKGAGSSTVSFLVEDDVADEERTKDLSRPVHEIVQSTCTNSEDGAIIIVEFCVIHKR